MCLGGVIARNRFSCKEEHILRKMHLKKEKDNEYGNCYKYPSVNFRVTHSRSIGEPITVHLNATP